METVVHLIAYSSCSEVIRVRYEVFPSEDDDTTPGGSQTLSVKSGQCPSIQKITEDSTVAPRKRVPYPAAGRCVHLFRPRWPCA